MSSVKLEPESSVLIEKRKESLPDDDQAGWPRSGKAAFDCDMHLLNGDFAIGDVFDVMDHQFKWFEAVIVAFVTSPSPPDTAHFLAEHPNLLVIPGAAPQPPVTAKPDNPTYFFAHFKGWSAHFVFLFLICSLIFFSGFCLQLLLLFIQLHSYFIFFASLSVLVLQAFEME